MTDRKIKALLVDDEPAARENLTDLLTKLCPEVRIIGEAVNVDQALEQIHRHKPDLVFLDIEMPRRSGFELIEAFTDPGFYIIFVTAYDQYALKAFEVSAIDYLLKPIDEERLQEAVRKVGIQQEKDSYKMRFEALKANTRSKVLKKLVVPYKSGHISVRIEDIIAMEAQRMYSRLSVTDPRKKTIVHYLYARELSHFESLFEHLPHFRRVHRSWMMNTHHIQFYSRKDRKIVLKGNLSVPLSKTYKPAFETFMGF